MKRSGLLGLTALTMTGLIGLTGCGVTPPTKAAGEAQPLELTAVSYTPNTLSAETLEQLVTEVNQSSDGALTLTATPAIDATAEDASADVIEMVRAGEVDVGVVAARTFDLEGSTSMQALSAPLVIESPAQAAAFLSDGVTEDMLAGLSDAGVVGLALVYDTLRQPKWFDGALLDPASLRGARVLTRPSQAGDSLFTALGARVDSRNGPDAEAAIAGGEVQGGEDTLERAAGFGSGVAGHPLVFTANVQLSVKANVIIVNPKTWSGLDDAQQSAMKDAAASTRSWATGQVIGLADAARVFCESHFGDVVVADDEQLTAWRQAVSPVVAALEAANPVTKAAIARMREIVRDTPSTDLPVACASVPSVQMRSVPAVGDQGVVAGQWRLVVSGQRLLDAGAAHQDASINDGTWTYTLREDGTFESVEPRGHACAGTFAVAADRLSLKEDATAGSCKEQFEFTFKREGDTMTWTPTADLLAVYAPFAAFFANPLQRIGEP